MAASAAERLAHPLVRQVRRNCRVATAAIEGLFDVVERCLRVPMPGALVYARPPMGKTQAVDYLSLHRARERLDVLTIRMSCAHHRWLSKGRSSARSSLLRVGREIL